MLKAEKDERRRSKRETERERDRERDRERETERETERQRQRERDRDRRGEIIRVKGKRILNRRDIILYIIADKESV